MKRCHNCGSEWVSDKKRPSVKEFCEKCTAYLHCCLNCRFYDPHAHNKCFIPTTDWVADRAGCNFCDEFDFADREEDAARPGEKKRAQEALKGLFGDETDEEHPEGRDAFDKLFGD